MNQTKIENVIENLEGEIVEVKFDDGEKSWLKIIDCSHINLNGSAWANRVTSLEQQEPLDQHGIEFKITEVEQIKDKNKNILYKKKKDNNTMHLTRRGGLLF